MGYKLVALLVIMYKKARAKRIAGKGEWEVLNCIQLPIIQGKLHGYILQIQERDGKYSREIHFKLCHPSAEILRILARHDLVHFEFRERCLDMAWQEHECGYLIVYPI